MKPNQLHLKFIRPAVVLSSAFITLAHLGCQSPVVSRIQVVPTDDTSDPRPHTYKHPMPETYINVVFDVPIAETKFYQVSRPSLDDKISNLGKEKAYFEKVAQDTESELAKLPDSENRNEFEKAMASRLNDRIKSAFASIKLIDGELDNLEVMKINGEQLPKVRSYVSSQYRFAWETPNSITISEELKPHKLFDIDLSSMDSSLTNLEKFDFNRGSDGYLTTVNTQAKDRTKETIANITTTALDVIKQVSDVAKELKGVEESQGSLIEKDEEIILENPRLSLSRSYPLSDFTTSNSGGSEYLVLNSKLMADLENAIALLNPISTPNDSLVSVSLDPIHSFELKLESNRSFQTGSATDIAKELNGGGAKASTTLAGIPHVHLGHAILSLSVDLLSDLGSTVNNGNGNSSGANDLGMSVTVKIPTLDSSGGSEQQEAEVPDADTPVTSSSSDLQKLTIAQSHIKLPETGYYSLVPAESRLFSDRTSSMTFSKGTLKEYKRTSTSSAEAISGTLSSETSKILEVIEGIESSKEAKSTADASNQLATLDKEIEIKSKENLIAEKQAELISLPEEIAAKDQIIAKLELELASASEDEKAAKQGELDGVLSERKALVGRIRETEDSISIEELNLQKLQLELKFLRKGIFPDS